MRMNTGFFGRRATLSYSPATLSYSPATLNYSPATPNYSFLLPVVITGFTSDFIFFRW